MYIFTLCIYINTYAEVVAHSNVECLTYSYVVYMYIYIYVYIYVCIYICMYTHVYGYIQRERERERERKKERVCVQRAFSINK